MIHGYNGESAMERAEVLRDWEPVRLSQRDRIERDPDGAMEDERDREEDE